MAVRPMTRSEIYGIWPQVRSSVPYRSDEALVEWCLDGMARDPARGPRRAFCDARGPAHGYLLLVPWKELADVAQVVCTRTDALLSHAQDAATGAGATLLSPLGSPWDLRPYRKSGFKPLQPVLSYLKSDRLDPALPVLPDAGRLGLVTDPAGLRTLDSRCFPPFWRLSEQEIESALSSDIAFGLTDETGLLVGYVSAVDYGHVASIGRLAVLPEFRRQGLGAALLATMIRALHEKGTTDISVSTQADNEDSQRLYRSFGFTFASEWLLMGWPHPADHPVWQLQAQRV